MPRFTFLAIAVAALLSGASCSRPSGPPKNVLLVSLDTTRADRLSCYGSASPKTPRLDWIAGRGVRFEHAYTVAPLTLPAHASLLTGVYPLEHRILDNSTYRLLPSYETLAETLKGAGFDTGAFVSAFVLRSVYGLDQGFDRYDDELPNEVAAGVVDAERTAGDTTSAALAWIRGRRDLEKPFFAWVHYFDPHYPYTAPEPYARAHGSSPFGVYEAEIAFVDACVGRLLDGLDEKGLLDRTAIVVVADHGEALGEHGESTHGYYIYDETMRIPFIVSAPGLLPEGRVVREGVARLVDVMPTILELFSLRAGPRIHGKSLVSAAKGEASAPDEAVLESFTAQTNFGWSRLRGLRLGARKAIDAPRPELYDLVADPRETRDLATSDPEGLRSLKSRLDRLERDLAHVPGAGDESPLQVLSENELRTIESIGYVAPRRTPRAPTADDGPVGADPKDKIVLYRTILEAKAQQGQGNAAGAVTLMKGVIEQEPSNAAVLDLYAKMLIQANRFDDAAEILERAAEADPANPEVYFSLGSAELKRGNAGAAVTSLLDGMRVYAEGGQVVFPGYLNAARLDLADALLRLGKRAEADRIVDEIRVSTGDDPEWMSKAALAYARLGLWDGSAEILERVVAMRPDHEVARVNLGSALVNLDRDDRAVEVLSEGIRRNPSNPYFLANLGFAHERAKRYAEALKAYRAYLRVQPNDQRIQARVSDLEKR